MDPLKFRPNWITLFVIIGSYVIGFHTIDAASSKGNSKVCQTEACKTIATSILQKMNQSVNPCENFYEFSCGTFAKNAAISPSNSQVGLITRLMEVVLNQMKNNIENQITKNDPMVFQKLSTFYKACMDEDQIEKNSMKEFMTILKKLGGWPVLLGKSYIDSKFDWIDTINKIFKMGYSRDYFLRVSIESDIKNNSKNLLYLDQAFLGISQEYLSQGLKNNIVEAYFKYMIDIAELFGADREEAKLNLGESLNFEIELAKISLSETQRRDTEKLYNPMKISEVQSKYPYISWLKYLNDFMSPFYRLTDDDVVIVSVPSYFESLGDLLSRTPKRVLANYALWRVADESISLLNQKVQDAYREFSASVTGIRNKTPRWESCVTYASDNLYVATSALYVRRNFNKASKDGVTDMVKHLRESFKNVLLEVDWMDEETRSAALQKLEQMILLVGYFDESLDDEMINNNYKNMKVYRKSYLKTVLSYWRLAIRKYLKRYGNPNLRVDWTDPDLASDVVDAFYNPTANTIQFPAGILQGDFFNKENPKYVNYGAIGSVIGHEMTHGLDDQGSGFDALGRPFNWWKPNTEKEYIRRAQCFIDQYSNYVDPQVNLNLNGELTQSENIADNVGLKLSYLAYLAVEKENGVEPTLPGFEDFTSRQLFWISFSNALCTKYRIEFLKDTIITDTHSPNQFRVIGSVSNNPDFAKDFNCPLGSPMNPDKKCSIW